MKQIFFATTNIRIRFLVISPMLIFLLLILVSAVLAPYFETGLMISQYQLTYSNLGKICHQFPTRSFYIFGSNMGLCSRCFSIYLTLFLCSIAFVYVGIRLSWLHRCITAFCLSLPLIVDGITQYYNMRISTNYIRLITGIMFGLGISIVFVSPYIKIATNVPAWIFHIKFRKEDRIMKSLTRNIAMLLVLSIGILTIVAQARAAEVTIKAGTPIPVKLDQSVSSETATIGQTVRFSVTRDVSVDNVVVIKAGSEVIGEVVQAQKTGSLGKEGKLSLIVRHALAVDNTKVPLRSTLYQTGEERVALSFLFCPFIKGTQSVIPANTETKAYVDYDTKIKTD